MSGLIDEGVKSLIKLAFEEDIGDGDHTTKSCIPHDSIEKAELLVKENGVIAGLELAEYIFHQFDPSLKIQKLKNDGDIVVKGEIVLTVTGKAHAILSAERLVLNFMQRLSGIATKTMHLTKSIKAYNCDVLDTRKTTPGLRKLEKWAVKMGGGMNHRYGLYDAIMIKDNHVDYAGGVTQAIKSVHDYMTKENKQLPVIIEVRNLNELEEVLRNGGVNRILLDNFSPELMKEAVGIVNGKFETEASGGIHEGNIVSYAATGVNYISIGAITHNFKSLDMSLKAAKHESA